MKIILEGIPQSQTRMKFSSRGGFGRVYDPKAKEKEEIRHSINEYIAFNYPDHELFKHPKISFLFHMPIPKSIRKKDYEKYSRGLLKHEKKPDIDNLIKLYLDCMTNIIFEDDNAVQLGFAYKLYNTNPKTIIFINDQGPQLSSLALFHELHDSECDKQTSFEKGYQNGFDIPDLLNTLLSSGKNNLFLSDQALFEEF